MDGENNRKPYQNGWFWGTTIFGNIHIDNTFIWWKISKAKHRTGRMHASLVIGGWLTQWNVSISFPIGSMYVLSGYIDHQNQRDMATKCHTPGKIHGLEPENTPGPPVYRTNKHLNQGPSNHHDFRFQPLIFGNFSMDLWYPTTSNRFLAAQES